MSGSSSKALNVNWSLSTASSDVLKIPRGILAAATSDNVQPIALLTVEAFGSTLPISYKTRRLVEKLAGRRNPTAVLEFLASEVGWRSNDAAYYLNSSDSGVRSLGLIATLITCCSSFETARILEQLVRQTRANSKDLLPTLGQLQDLVDALVPKLNATGFADKIIHAEILVNHLANQDCVFGRTIQDVTCPSAEQIVRLVNMMQKLFRINELDEDASESDEEFAMITADYSHAWIFALIEWFTEAPPHLVDPQGVQLLKQNGHRRITLVLKPKDDLNRSIPVEEGVRSSSLRIEIFHSIGAPPELWEYHGKTQKWQGFVSLGALGRHRRHEFCIDEDSTFRAAVQAVSCILQCLLQSPEVSVLPEDLRQYRVSTLPSMKTVALTFATVLGPGAELRPMRVESIASAWDLPLAKSVVEYLTRKCSCRECSNGPEARPFCRVQNLKDFVHLITAEILGLALVEVESEDTELLVQANKFNDTSTSSLMEVMETFSEDLQTPPVVTHSHLREVALILTGMVRITDDMDQCLVFSAYGQVIYFSFLASMQLSRTGMLQMRLAAGQIRFENDLVKYVLGTGKCFKQTVEERGIAVDRPRNLMGNVRFKWQVHRSQDHLRLSSTLEKSDVVFFADPLNFVTNLTACLFVGSCEHDAASVMAPDQYAFYVTPACEPQATEEDAVPGTIQVVAVAGEEKQRYWAVLAGSQEAQVIIRGKTCLKCCLDIARRAEYSYLIV